MQKGKVIAYAPRKLKIHEKSFTTHDLELGAVVFALKTWRRYLYGTKSVIYIDHKSLQHIFKQKELNMRQRRWIKLFSDYECEICYHPRKANVVVDALSEISKVENVTAEMLRGMDQLIERKEDRVMNFIWVPLIDDVRTLIMDEAHALTYLVHPRMDKTYYDLRDMYGGHKYLADTNLNVHFKEIKVDKTLCFVEEPVEIIDREVKSMNLSRIPIVKSIGTRSERKLASGSSSSRVVRAKTSASKDDVPILSISNDDEGKFPVHLVLSEAWKSHLDNQMDFELLDLHDRCYGRQAMVDNTVNKRAREFLQVIEKMSGEADVIKTRERSREEECNLDRMMLEIQKWEGYQVTLSTFESKVDSLEAEKARLEAVEVSLRREVEELKEDRRDVVSKVVHYATMELVHSDELDRLVGTLVSSAITYGRCRAYVQVAAMKEPFDLSKAKGYCSSYKKEHT
ncbi:hypothetical protein Tco_0105311 [Tanacetum coccineum]